MTALPAKDVFRSLTAVWAPDGDSTPDWLELEFSELAREGAGFVAAMRAAAQSGNAQGALDEISGVWESLSDGACVRGLAARVAETWRMAGVNYATDLEHLPGMWKGTIACTGLALAQRTFDVTAGPVWMRRAVKCWNPGHSGVASHSCAEGRDIDIDVASAEWRNGSVPHEAFQHLRAQGYNVEEAWDLTSYLLTGSARTTGRPVDMRVLFVVAGDGEVGTLRLELLAEGRGLTRHPHTLLMPCDQEFLEAIRLAEAYATVHCPNLSGAVRWTLALGDLLDGAQTTRLDIPEAAAGPSLGGALGVGLHLLSEGNVDSDLSVAITAKLLDASGNLGTIGGADSKFEAAASSALWPIYRVLFATGQTQIPTSRALQDVTVSTVTAALDQFRVDIRPRRLIRQAVRADSARIELPDRMVDHGMQDGVGESGVFITVPLMEEVEVTDLPSMPAASGDQPDGGSSCDEAGRRVAILWRWEEEQWSRKRVTYKARDVEGVVAEEPHFVLIGPPGCGKTTIVQWLAWRSAGSDQPLLWGGRRVIPAPIRLSAWQASRKKTLPHYLATWSLKLLEGSSNTRSAPTADHWAKWLSTGEVLLLFDGLDEVDTSWAKLFVRKALADYASCPAVLSCRTVSRDMLQRCIPEMDACPWPIYTPSPFDSEAQQRYVQRYPFESAVNGDDLLEQIGRVAGADLMAANPLLLSIICFVADTTGEALPATRSQLYDLAVDELLKPMEARAREGGAPVDKPGARTRGVHNRRARTNEARVDVGPATIRDVLERLALSLKLYEKERATSGNGCRDSAVTLRFRRKQVTGELVTLLTYPAQYGRYRDPTPLNTPMVAHPEENAEGLLTRLESCSRLLVREQSGSGVHFRFLHRTFMEYLAACALVRWAEGTPRFPDGLGLSKLTDDGTEESKIKIADEWTVLFDRIDAKNNPPNGTVYTGPALTALEAFIETLDQAAWLPEWREVFLLLAGSLEDPVPLLDLLSDYYVKRDDMFRHRLALAAECLAEIDMPHKSVAVG